jgi:ATP-dependent Lon protease
MSSQIIHFLLISQVSRYRFKKYRKHFFLDQLHLIEYECRCGRQAKNVRDGQLAQTSRNGDGITTIELQMLELKANPNKVRTDLDKQQRDYFLNAQLKTIQEELGGNSSDLEYDALQLRAKKKKWQKPMPIILQKNWKAGRMNPQAPDYSIQMNYLELLLDLPWSELPRIISI